MMSQAYKEKIGDFDNGGNGLSGTEAIDQNFWQGEEQQYPRPTYPRPDHLHQGRDEEQPKYLKELKAMGFDEDVALLVLGNSQPDTPLHELVATLSEMVCP
jgi:hypothetical protein